MNNLAVRLQKGASTVFFRTRITQLPQTVIPVATSLGMNKRSLFTFHGLGTRRQYVSPIQPFSRPFPLSRAFRTARVLNNSKPPQEPQHNEQTSHESQKSTITKATLLSQANNAFSRFAVHIKWPLLRGNRRISSLDIISAFVSWLVMGNILWIILGTTTFGLVIMYSLHYFDNVLDRLRTTRDDDEQSMDHSVLGYVTSSILGHGLGIKIEFKRGNILPELKDGKLRFKNFKVSSLSQEVPTREKHENDSIKFNARVEAMDVTLSFNKWYEGKGLIYDLEIFGMNGELFKSDIVSNPHTHQPYIEEVPFAYNRYNENIHLQYDLSDHDLEELSAIHHHRANRSPLSFIDSNYQLDQVKVHDSYFEIYNDESKKNPLKITIFNCDLPQLRGDRVLIDFFNANNATGAINDSMFTLHKRQDIMRYNVDSEGGDKIIRFKLDGINMGLISSTNPHSKFNWIVNGKAEIIADITLPNLNTQEFQLMSEYKRVSHLVSEVITELANVTNPQEHENESTSGNPLLKGALAAIYHTFSKPASSTDPSTQELSEYVLVNFKIKFYDLKASLPKYLPTATSTGAPLLSLQNLRTLITFINNYEEENASAASTIPPIVIKTTVIEKLSDLYNIENLGQTKLVDSIVSDVYEDLLKLVKQDEKRIIHEKSNMWSHSLASQLLLLGLGVIV